MKKTAKIIILCIALCAVLGVFTACNAPSEGLEYVLNRDMTFTVKSIGLCGEKEVVIPDTYNGAPVTEIGEFAFSGYEITKVTIPESVSVINEYAFRGCTKLEEIIIKGNNLTIENRAFSECSALKKITIEEGVNYVEEVFWGSGVNEVEFEDGVVEIPMALFRGLKDLKSIVIPNTIHRIGAFAFSHSGLESVTLPDSLTDIGTCAFSNTALTSIVIPASVTGMGSRVFSDCENLKYVTSAPSSAPATWAGDWHADSDYRPISAELLWNGHVHTLTETARTPATCITLGKVTYHCSGCNEDRYETLPKNEEHVAQGGWRYDDTGHWKLCMYCVKNFERAPHDYVNGNCTVCGKSA